MKQLILFLLIAAGLTGCTKSSDSESVIHLSGPRLVMLKVDYLTLQLQGGKVFDFPMSLMRTDSIPLTVSYHPPDDFGNITFKYAPTSDTIFDGSIIWMGRGNVHYPQFNPAGSFATSGSALLAPGSSSVQNIL